jgi:hypothetical protein
VSFKDLRFFYDIVLLGARKLRFQVRCTSMPIGASSGWRWTAESSTRRKLPKVDGSPNCPHSGQMETLV